MRRLALLLVLAVSVAARAGAADPPDVLAQARQAYNQGRFEAAVQAADRARLVPAQASSADLIAARGRVHKLSFFIHNFMDACSLEKQRVDACSFMVATQIGPISMCLHNAKRDEFILAPIRTGRSPHAPLWDPLTGEVKREPGPAGHATNPAKVGQRPIRAPAISQ